MARKHSDAHSFAGTPVENLSSGSTHRFQADCSVHLVVDASFSVNWETSQRSGSEQLGLNSDSLS